MRRLTHAVDTAPLDQPGTELLRPLVAWLRPGTGAGRIVELEGALAGLTGDHLLTPVLQQDLARALVTNTGQTGAEGLRRATDLLEQAAAGMAADHPLYEETVRMLAGALVSVAATDTTAESRARAEQVAAEVLARSGDDDERRGPDLFLRSLVGLLRGIAGEERDERAAVHDLVTAIDALPAEHALRSVAVGQLGALLADRHLTKGMLDNLDAARHILDEATTAARDPDTRAFLTAVSAMGRVHEAIGADRLAPVTAAAADELRDALADLPDGHPLRGNLELVLAVVDLKAAVNGGGDVPTALAAMRKVAAEGTFPGIPEGFVASMVGTVDVLRGLVDPDPAAVAAAINTLERQVAQPVAFPLHRAGQRALLGKAYLAAHDMGIDPDVAAARAVVHLEDARRLLEELHAGVPEADVLRDLAAAYRRSGEHERSRDSAFAALAAHAGTVLLQTGVAHAVVTARGAANDAAALARWCLADDEVAGAVQALELGRGLAIYAATSALQVPRVLTGAGRPELAAAWAADVVARRDDPAPWALAEVAADAGGDRSTDYARAAADLRHRVLEVLRATDDGKRLFTAPPTTAIGNALATVGGDAFVYLLPGDAESEGRLLVIDRGGVPTAVPAPLLRIEPDGPPARFRATPKSDEAPWRAALEAVCDWAGPAVVEPLLEALGSGPDPAHVVLVPSGVLGAVPWAAARLRTGRPEPRYACTELVLSTAASARQFLDVTARAALPVGLDPVLLADPRGDLLFAMDEVLALQEAFYPNAAVLGDFRGIVSTDDDTPLADGLGTPAEVLERLPGARTLGASLLHLACHAWTASTAEASYLELTERLTIHAVVEHAAGRAARAPGPVVVLSACQSDFTEHDDDEALTLATSVLVAGAVAVVGSRWAVADKRTAILMFAFHHFLAAVGQPPADALRSAQLWMLDPGRAELQAMPEALLGDMDDMDEADLTGIDVWAAFAHQGR